MKNFMNSILSSEFFKTHLESAFITFASTFFFVLAEQIKHLDLSTLTQAALLGVILAIVRAAGKVAWEAGIKELLTAVKDSIKSKLAL